jgi:predicted ATPase
LRNDATAALSSAEHTIAVAQQHGIQFLTSAGEVYAAWARSRLSFAQAGATQLREAIAAYVKSGNKIAMPFLLCLLAERESDAQDVDAAVATIEEALSRANEFGEHYSTSFLQQIRGDILLKAFPADSRPGEEAYKAAIAIAKQQGARAFELRAALSLAKLYQSTNRPADAHAILAPALEGFSPTPEMREIAEAQALLEQLEGSRDSGIAAEV